VRLSRCEVRDHQLPQKRSLALVSILRSLAAAKIANAYIYEIFGAIGTKRTSRAGLAMSVDWGRPEVADGASNRRD